MAEQTGIEWCDATFNPWIGCTRVSPACDDCYAARSTPARALGVAWGSDEPRRRTADATWALPKRWNAQPFAGCNECSWRGTPKKGPSGYTCGACGHLNLAPQRRRVFCASLADVFDNEVDPVWRADLLALIRATPNLDWLLLTKRIGNVDRMLVDAGVAAAARGDSIAATAVLPPNVWLGATVVNQAEADRDIPKLLAVPARVRFLSIEPMLGAIDLRLVKIADNAFAVSGDAPPEWQGVKRVRIHVNALRGAKLYGGARLDWVIAGGESGPKARPAHPDWFRSLRDQCAAADTPFHFKQWGEWVPRGPELLGYPVVDGVPRFRMTDTGEDGSDLSSTGDDDVWMNRAGKQAAGRLLDGVEHNGFPA